MKILVTGADGFVGAVLSHRLVEQGHEVTGAVRPDGVTDVERARRETLSDLQIEYLELLDPASIRAVASGSWDAVVHLAALSSVTDAEREPARAWEVNTLGTARLANELGEKKLAGEDPLLLLVSTAEVYGAGPAELRSESDPVNPVSPYAASKLGAEIAALEVHRRTGLRVVVARTFPHTGPGQDTRFVAPAFLERIRFARKIGAPVVKVGRIDPVREFMHVADVARAYAAMIEQGRSGQVYNVSCGRAVSIKELFFMLSDALGHRVIPESDHDLIRPVDIPHLVGDSTKLRDETGWQPRMTLEETIREMVDAETD
ncbi:MAG: GDP-mannose 4,6-dehydratase [Gemmatimonadota bacterium]|nr:MAG: GDP-mannose 4,6-dehydratase [Gemmatimonadota bacterium]